MAKESQQMQMPGVFGGLMRYDAEYESNFMLSPTGVVVFIIAVILFVVALKIFFPVAQFLYAPLTAGILLLRFRTGGKR